MTDYSYDYSQSDDKDVAEVNTDVEVTEELANFNEGYDEEVRPREDGKVAIDWPELEGALENNSPDLNSFMNRYSGDVIRIFHSGRESEHRLDAVEADDAYVYIEPISSREQYQWMEDFIDEMDPSPLRDKLSVAVDGKGAFRRFKDVLVENQEKREEWFGKRSVKINAHIEQWLKENDIKAVSRDEQQARASKQISQHKVPVKTSFGTNNRRKAHELVDLVPSKDLGMVVSFLQFINSRFHKNNL